MRFRQNIGLLVLLLGGCIADLRAQTTIVLRDSVKINSEIVSLTEELLIIRDGSLSVAMVHKVFFTDSLSAGGKAEVIAQLVAKKIEVYVGGTRVELQGLPQPKVEPAVVSTPTPTPGNTLANAAPSGELLTYFGAGLGIPYGGIGFRVTVTLDKGQDVQPVGFLALGYALSGVGYNVGAAIRIRPEQRLVPVVSAMYGYNAAIKVIGLSEYDKVYYGPTFGVGMEIGVANEGAHIQLEINVPFRSRAFTEDLNALQRNPQVTGLRDPSPLAFAIGYHTRF